MKINIEISEDILEDEITIKCKQITEQIQSLQKLILSQSSLPLKLIFYKNNEEYYFPVSNVLFFETNADSVFAHTSKDIYKIKYRLYELETMLSQNFIRISKSAIVNTDHIMSISRNLYSSSLIKFHKSHKQVYVSRLYYKVLKERLNERG